MTSVCFKSANVCATESTNTGSLISFQMYSYMHTKILLLMWSSYNNTPVCQIFSNFPYFVYVSWSRNILINIHTIHTIYTWRISSGRTAKYTAVKTPRVNRKSRNGVSFSSSFTFVSAWLSVLFSCLSSGVERHHRLKTQMNTLQTV